jgi:hypothetical protein
MKKLHHYILENTDFLHGVFVSIQWVLLFLVFALTFDNDLKNEWLESAFVLSVIGYISIILSPIFIFQCKFIFRENSKKILHGIIIVLFYSEIVFIIQFIFIAIFSRNDPLFCFTNPGIIFMFSCLDKILFGKQKI